MTKMWKRTITVLLVFALLGCAALIGAAAAADGGVVRAAGETVSGKCGSGVTWTLDLDTGVLTISGTGNITDYSNTTYSKAIWHPYSSSIQTVSIGGGVIRIGDNAFRDCTSLTNVTIPDGVTYIGVSAFSGCTSLTDNLNK